MTMYSITHPAAVVDKDEAAEGETVTVTMSDVSPGKTGYTVVVRNTATSAVLYTQSGLNARETWTFTMPAADVTVSVS